MKLHGAFQTALNPLVAKVVRSFQGASDVRLTAATLIRCRDQVATGTQDLVFNVEGCLPIGATLIKRSSRFKMLFRSRASHETNSCSTRSCMSSLLAQFPGKHEDHGKPTFHLFREPFEQEDGNLLLWNLAPGRPRPQRLTGQSGSITCIKAG